MFELFPYIALFFFGTIIGSFLNVVIYRLPRGESLAFPASHCPHCKRPIKPYENVPIFSFLFLRGKCAGCKSPISLQYPAVEALTGALLTLLLWRFGWSIDLGIFSALTLFLVALSVIDLQTMRLPNTLTLGGAIVGIVLTLALRFDYWLMMLLGGLVGFGLLYVMALIGRLLFRRETLGMGDIKLAGMMGLYLGPALTAGMYIIAIFIGAAVGGGLIILGGRRWGEKIPFGPYLAAGAIVSLIWGGDLWDWYIGLAFH